VRFLWLLLFLLLPGVVSAEPANHSPVSASLNGRLAIATEPGHAELPLHVSADWTRALPDVTRALVLVHGDLRDANATLRVAEAARYAGGEAGHNTLLVVPQFLTAPDMLAHHLPSAVLHWSVAGWVDGEAALGPAPVSSFAVIDAILARLNDAKLFPTLRQVVIAGHSAGGQLVQRYAVVGRGMSMLTQRGIAVRYVVANPSSYLWFGDDRPAMVKRGACPGADHWKYGLAGAPAYVEQIDRLEERYIARDVIYLLGEADTDPAHPFLDKSCEAEAQGATRYARGMHYLLALEQRHPNLVRHRILSVWGIGHDAGSMFVSPCGLAALFDRLGCAAF
jgi:pimeloyl-ACP methyl ester carboxylesterase